MRFSILLALIASTLAAEDLLTTNTDEVADRALHDVGIAIYTSRPAWLKALTANNFDVAVEEFESVMPSSGRKVSLGLGANDVGLFDINISSLAKPNYLQKDYTGYYSYQGIYEKGELEVSIDNFDIGTIYGFGGHWDVEDLHDSNVMDFVIKVDGAAVDIGNFPNRRGGRRLGIGFVGIIDLSGFSKIEFFTSGSDATSVSIAEISLTNSLPPTSAPSPLPTELASTAPSPIPTSLPTTPLPSAKPTTSSIPTAFPTVSPTGVPSPLPTMLPSKMPSSSPTSQPTISSVPTALPTVSPTEAPSSFPSALPTTAPSSSPTSQPTISLAPSGSPTISFAPSTSTQPSDSPSNVRSGIPSRSPTVSPTGSPSSSPITVSASLRACRDVVKTMKRLGEDMYYRQNRSD